MARRCCPPLLVAVHLHRPSGRRYGDPLARNPARVRDNVANGLLSREVARCDYGDVLTLAGTIDEARTARLRAG
jgi:N-methylhydantoinase B